MAYGKSVNLFLVNGKADSLVIAELKNWDAKAIRIPRIEVPACDRAELQQQGVYFLICSDPNTGDRSVYIGAADRRFTLSMGGVKAVGEATADGFVVFKGATINPKTNTKSLNKNAAAKRDAMIASDKVENNTTTEDILFTSPSAAADFLVGYSVSGPANWKDKKGTALKDRTDI